MKPAIPILVIALTLAARGADKLLPFQGYLADASGTAINGQAKVVQFRIYDAPVSGTAVWAGEVHKLSVNAGLVNTILGTKTSLATVDFALARYLEITVDANGDNAITAADPPLLPRQVIVPVVFAAEAAQARQLNGNDWTAVFDNGNPATGKLKASIINSGSIPASAIVQDNSLVAAHLAANAVGESEIAANAVTTSKIANGTISLEDLSVALVKYLVPTGTVVAFAGTAAPYGWLMCNGTTVSRTTYNDLYLVIGTAHGAGNGTSTFHLPDYRGRLLRGVDGGIGRDLDSGSRTAMNTSGNVGNSVGSVQGSILPKHAHCWGYSDTGDQYTRKLLSWDADGNNNKIVLQDNRQMQIENGNDDEADNFKEVSPGLINQSFYTDRNTGSVIYSGQVAPPNAYVNYIIKY